jgi:hypothetical protein
MQRRENLYFFSWKKNKIDLYIYIYNSIVENDFSHTLCAAGRLSSACRDCAECGGRGLSEASLSPPPPRILLFHPLLIYTSPISCLCFNSSSTSPVLIPRLLRNRQLSDVYRESARSSYVNTSHSGAVGAGAIIPEPLPLRQPFPLPQDASDTCWIEFTGLNCNNFLLICVSHSSGFSAELVRLPSYGRERLSSSHNKQRLFPQTALTGWAL